MSHSSRVIDVAVAPQATADQRHGVDAGQTPHQDTASPSQHARPLTPLPQPIKGQAFGGLWWNSGTQKMLRKQLPSCQAHDNQRRGSSEAKSPLSSSVIGLQEEIWLMGMRTDAWNWNLLQSVIFVVAIKQRSWQKKKKSTRYQRLTM